MSTGSERRDRPLTVFGFDPSVGRRLGNHLTLRLPFEPVQPGPIGRYLEVVEPPDAGYHAVDLESPSILLAGGLPPSEFDVCFHQQMVYAVATHTIDLFQNALGRAIRWPWEGKLRLHPHGGDGQWAAFDLETGSLHFGYFPAPSGVGPAGQWIFTCLSFDMVMHGVVRALLTALGRPERAVEGLDMLLPLLHHFTRPDAVLETVLGTKGEVDDSTPLLRFAPQLTDTGLQADGHGAKLVEAVFEALFAVYAQRAADLVRIAEPTPSAPSLHPDLAQRMARELVMVARRFLELCVRAIDYCPPGPVRLGDYLRALVTVSHDFAPERGEDRAALIAAFRSRDIAPETARSWVEEGVRWPSVTLTATVSLRFQDGDDDEIDRNRQAIVAFLNEHRRALGLSPDHDVTVDLMPDRLSERLAGNGAVVREAVVLVNQPGAGRASVLFDDRGAVRYVIADTPPEPSDRPLGDSRPPEAPTVRPLSVYAFDPSQGQRFGNVLTVQVPYEPLQPGPVGDLVAVIDYDAPNDRYYEPVDLEHPSALGGGLELRDDDPRFHQQMVYAVASETIRRFEFALGRKVIWGWKGQHPEDPLRDRLRILPHAFQEPNAYFDGELGALLFGYFVVQPGDEVVFTCLSHDIVAHETTHALVDNVRPLLLSPTGPDALAFHEAFADIVALLQHFSFREALAETVLRTGGRIHAASLDPEVARRDGDDGGQPAIQAELTRHNPLVEVARQFGEAMGTRKALREAIGTKADEHRLETVFEPHERGSILVAAVFDAFFSVYVRRTSDLLRLARSGGGVSPWGDLHPDLAARLTREAAKTARHFLTICVRALDYLPPVDVTFGDFLRALLTSDADIVPEDPWKYRAALIEAFRSRGIRTEGISGTSEGALRWSPVEGDLTLSTVEVPWPFGDTEEIVETRLLTFAEANAERLGLVPDLPVEIQGFRLQDTRRVDPSMGLRQREYVAQFVQAKVAPVDPADPGGATLTVRGGSTVLFWADGRARYVISRPVSGDQRADRQREFQRQLRMNLADSPFDPTDAEPTLARLHRGW